MNKILGALFASFMMIGSANAVVVTHNLNTEISGATSPAGVTPWLMASFDDNDTAGTVTLTLQANFADDFGFVGSFYFNLDPDLNAALLGIGAGTETGWGSFLRGNDQINAGTGSMFDGVINFQSNFLTGTGTFTFEFVMAGLTADSFNFANSDGYLAAAHIQGLGVNGEESGWIATATNPTASVPEPATLLLMSFGLLGLGFAKRRKA